MGMPSNNATGAHRIKDVPLTHLFVDYSYQRPTNQERVKHMLEHPRPEWVGVLQGSQRGDGAIAVVDGGHRLAFLRGKSYEYATVLMHTGLTISQEAALFSGLNRNSRRPTGLHAFMADRIAGDVTALEIDRIARSYGFTIGLGADQIRHVSAMQAAYHLGNLNDVLRLVSLAWGTGRYVDGMTYGIAIWLKRYGNDAQHFSRLLTFLRSTTSKDLSQNVSGGTKLGGGMLPKLTADYLDQQLGTSSLPAKTAEAEVTVKMRVAA